MYMPYVKMCKRCVKMQKDDIHNGYYPFIRDDVYVCPICNSELIDTIIKRDEYLTIVNVSCDNSFIQAMIKLKQDDIIEFQSRMCQFKTQLNQQESNNKVSNAPKCPTCNSTNIKKITGTERAMSVVGLGIFSKKINKSYKCLNCKCTW